MAPDAMGKGEGREDGVILHLGINEERGYFRQLAQPSSYLSTLALIIVSDADVPANAAKQTPQLRRTFYPGNSLLLLRQSLRIVCRSFFP